MTADDRVSSAPANDDSEGEAAAARLRRLSFRSWRRGFREADLILGPFADTHLAGFDAGQLAAYEALLEEHDQDLYGWIIGREPAPAEHDGPVLALIQAFRFQANDARPDRGA